MTVTETWTVGRLLTWTTEYLQKNGSQSARLDAEVLLSHALECQRIELYTTFDTEPSEEGKAAFREMVRRRAEGTPVAYLVGYKEFYSETFEVNPDVLIPRPETEHLVVEALDRAKELVAARQQAEASSDGKLSICDVGTGSGIIAITLATQFSECNVLAIDKSAAALELAELNATKIEVPHEQIQFLQSDLLSECEPGEKFDLIVSNPPYVSEAEYRELDKSVREFEPELALVSGPDGSELLVELMQQAANFLAPDGFLMVEASPMLFDRLSDWQPPGLVCEKITKDLAGLGRVGTFRLA
ncbi:MAG: peptide chain release factor N(5)-glutamine methyltransferase [Planctomycetota bacterium]|nr:peptide chain release factor N(5)-glutamine methyltransferase [Planctomycetota bacterium]